MRTPIGTFLLRLALTLSMVFCISLFSYAQCTLGPGDLVFTGYNQLDDGTNGSTTDDSFSFLLLKDIPAGQDIFFTDLGWTGSSFQTAINAPSDAVLKWTADVAYPAGTEIIVYCKYTLVAKDINNVQRGTVTVAQSSYNTTPGGASPQEQMSLAEFSGDQIFAFTNSIAAPNFLAGISINKPATSQWEASLLPTAYGADKSIKPTALNSGAQDLAISFADPDDPFVNAAPVARYKREIPGNAAGLPSDLLTKIKSAANWEIKSDGNYYIPLFSAATPIVVTGVLITAQPVNRTNLCPGSATSFSITATGVCSYQWEISDDGITFAPIAASATYTNVTTATLGISNITGLNAKKYRVKLTGAHGTVSNIVTLTPLNPTVVLNATALPPAIPNTAYTTTINVASGGNGTFTYSIESGALPNGLTLNTATGEISGTPTVGGTSNFVIKATDNCSTPNSGTQPYTIIVGMVDQSITLTDYTKTYGDGTFTLPLNSSGGLPISYSSATPSVATVVGNTVTIVGAGSTTITASQAGNASYNPAPSVQKLITVDKKNITLALNATPVITKVYNNNTTATLVPANYTLTGVLNPDVVTVSGTANYDTGTKGTGKTITANTFVLAGADKDNYTLTTTTATTTGNITAAPITLALNATPLITKVYDNNTLATLVAANYTLSGVLITDAVTVSGTANYDTGTKGTGKTITANAFVLAGADKDNYSLTTATATTTGNITAAPITLALNATPLITKVYDNNTTATLDPANYTLSGVLNTDAVTVSGTANYDTGTKGTGKTITANTFVLAGADKDNYTLTTTTATTTGEITAAPITLALNATPQITKVYDDNTTATLVPANYTLTGVLNTDAVTVTGTANYDTGTKGTGKTITAGTFVLDGADKDNYSLTTATATTTGDITALPITLALNATPLITKVYDNNTTATLDPTNYTLSGVLNTDAVTVTGTANYDTGTKGTGKTITANTFVLAGADKDNYSLTTTSATTTGNITAAPITLTLNATPLITKVYDDNTTATLDPANYTLTGVLNPDVVTVSGTANYDTGTKGTGKTITAGTFVLDGADKDNYSLTTTTATTTGDITALPITLALNATPLITKVYDNNTTATLTSDNYTLSGVLNTDVVTVTGTANYDTNIKATGKTITANTFVLAGADKDNYSLTTTSATTTGEITAAPITLALNAIPLISKVYDNNTTATLVPANYTLSGVLNTDVVTVSGTANYDTGTKATGKTITANAFVLAGADKDNYSLTTTSATTTGDITALPITLALNATPAISKVYDNNTTATLDPANYTLSGVLNTDAVSVSGTANYDTGTKGTGKTITAGTFVLDGADKDNYSLTTTSATTTGEITAAPITLALNATPAISKVYDNNTTATLDPANYTLTGVLNTDVVTVSGTANYDTNTKATGKTITANAFVLGGADKDNYSLTTTTATTTGDITAAPITLALNATPLISKVYDNNMLAALDPANYTLTGVLNTDVVTVTGTANYDTGTKGTGKTITANTFVLAGADKDNYSLTTTTATTTGDITAAPITLALNATPVISKVYDNNTTATLVPANYSLTGVLGTDAVSVTGTANYDTNAKGTGKTITANAFVLDGADKDNYSLTTTTATTTGDITGFPLTLVLNAAPLISKVYDNNTLATLDPANYTLTGVLGTDAVSVTGTANYDTDTKGASKTITAGAFILAGADKDNYSLTTTSATTTGEITAAPLTLALNATPLITKVYDNNTTATLVPANYSLTGVLGTDAVTVSGTANYDTGTKGAGKTITAGAFILDGADKDNYDLTTTTATTTGDITAAPITLALNATPLISKVYDNNTLATLDPANYSLTGVLGTDAVSVTGTAAYDNKDAEVGKTVTANTFVLAGADKDNYTLTTTTATTTGDIIASPITLALNAMPLISKVYDNNTLATLDPANYSLTGILGTDAVTVSGNANYDTGTKGAGKTITANTFVLDGADKGNYSLTTTSATTTGDITAAPITLALNATPLISKVYDNNTLATLTPANYTLTGVLGSDAVSVTGTASYDNKDAEVGKTVTANTFVLAGADKDNYTLTTTAATTTGDITASPITLALNATPLISKVYDNNTLATLDPANYSLTGILGTDAVTVSGTANYDTSTKGAGKTITAGTFVLDGADKANYSLTTTTATTTGDITASPLTLALNATPLISKVYDNNTLATLDPANYTLTGVLGTDVVSVTGTAIYDNKDAEVGKTVTANTFVLAGADKDNYTLTTTTATTTGDITASPITLALNATPLISKVYDNNTLATLDPANYTLTGVLGSDVVTVSGTAGYDTKAKGTGKTITANSFVLDGANKGNYSLTTTTATTTGDITASPITLALNATPLISKVYDNNTLATLDPANYTLTGVLGTDAVTVSGTANYDTSTKGAGKTITANTFVLDGADKDNYSLTTTTATTTGDITASPLTLALNATPLISKVYDNNTLATLVPANYTLTGVLGTDAVSVTGTANYDNKDAEVGKTVTANTFVLAGADKENYSLTTTTATTTGDITASPITLALNATPLIHKVYDNNTLATLDPANYSLTGVLGTDAVTVSGTANYDNKDAGTGKTITANSFVLAGSDKNNYSLTTTTATTTGDITTSDITLALNATPLISKAYDNNTTATLVPANYTLTGVLGTDAVSVTGTAVYDNKTVGTGKAITANSFVLAGADKNNYNLSTTTATTTGNITASPITLTLNATPLISKTYDNTTLATLDPANYTLTGVLGTDAVSVTGTAAYDNKDAGTGKTITANTFVLAGADKDNYSLSTTTASTTGNIALRDLTVTAEDKTKFQGTANPPLTITYSGFINGEGINNLTTPPTATTTANTGSSIGSYDIIVNGGIATNYNFNYVKGTLKVVPGTPTDVLLATVPLFENRPVGATAGTLSSTSENPSAVYTYSLVTGEGDTDNEAFTIIGNQLKSNVAFDFETKATYSIRVRSTTQFGLWLDKQINISISDVNEIPTLSAVADQNVCYTTSVQNIPLAGISAGPETIQKTTLTLVNSNPNLLQSISVTGTGTNGNISYRIKNGAAGTATITITVKDNGGTANGGVDTYSKTFVLTVNPLPTVAIQADKGTVIGNSTEVSKGETVLLTATGGSTYSWTADGSIISGQNTATLTVRPRETTTYTVTVTNANGCSETGTFTVKVLDDLLKIKATNILTPNRDGYNDRWIVDNIDFYPNNQVKVFDKSGRLLYSKKGYDNSWEGTYNGEVLADGTYYYIIDFGTNRRSFKGFITIVTGK